MAARDALEDGAAGHGDHFRTLRAVTKRASGRKRRISGLRWRRLKGRSLNRRRRFRRLRRARCGDRLRTQERLSLQEIERRRNDEHQPGAEGERGGAGADAREKPRLARLAGQNGESLHALIDVFERLTAARLEYRLRARARHRAKLA